jgi:DNA replication protein DnaC
MATPAFSNIPRNKLELAQQEVIGKISDPHKQMVAKDALVRFYEANIPVKYWNLDMNGFTGDPRLLKWYKESIEDIPSLYKNGSATCLQGSFGLGKTLTVTNILKQALLKGYSALYVTLGDILTSVKSFDFYEGRKELLMTHFVVIDELDPRYMATDAAADMHGRLLEDILRYRTSNKMPLFLCTNATDVEQAFSGSIKQAISSLLNYVDMFPVLGKDYRKQEKI